MADYKPLMPPTSLLPSWLTKEDYVPYIDQQRKYDQMEAGQIANDRAEAQLQQERNAQDTYDQISKYHDQVSLDPGEAGPELSPDELEKRYAQIAYKNGDVADAMRLEKAAEDRRRQADADERAHLQLVNGLARYDKDLANAVYKNDGLEAKYGPQSFEGYQRQIRIPGRGIGHIDPDTNEFVVDVPYAKNDATPKADKWERYYDSTGQDHRVNESDPAAMSTALDSGWAKDRDEAKAIGRRRAKAEVVNPPSNSATSTANTQHRASDLIKQGYVKVPGGYARQ